MIGHLVISKFNLTVLRMSMARNTVTPRGTQERKSWEAVKKQGIVRVRLRSARQTSGRRYTLISQVLNDMVI